MGRSVFVGAAVFDGARLHEGAALVVEDGAGRGDRAGGRGAGRASGWRSAAGCWRRGSSTCR